MKSPRAAVLSAFLAIYSGAVQGVEYTFHHEAGYRNDALRWNIAADTSGTATPNILSELTWEDLQILQLRLGWRMQAQNGFHLRASGAYGWIFDGRNQDSDYAGNNRTFEFSRSNNDTHGDNVWDASAAIGYRFTLGDPAFQLTPLLGISHHAQNLRISNGRQTIPNLGSFSGLDSTYQAQWKGSWLGVEMEWKVAPDTQAFLRLEHHPDADYYAQANWNLRNDFAHPKSFEHRAKATGNVISFGGYGPVSGRWVGRFTIDYQRWEGDPGTDQIFFANGTTSFTRLNEVEWKSWSISGGVELRF